jgi:uncharacterized membrane protein
MEHDVVFDRVLKPNPPMSPRALSAIFAAAAGVNLIFALGFLLHGAWPIAPFLGADVALLGWALRSAAAAARREEHLTLTASTLRIRRRPGGDEELNPYWVRVDLPERGPLTLWSHGRGVGVGAFLGPDEKLSLAQALRTALWRLRQSS